MRTPRSRYAKARRPAIVASAAPRLKERPLNAEDGGPESIDIPRGQCSLHLPMPEANADHDSAPAGQHRTSALPRFDEDAPRQVPERDLQDGSTLSRLVGVMQRLLGPGGCPWDREQSFQSLRKYVLEEACEVIDAIDSGSRDALREELGDLLLQIVFQAELARLEGKFAIDDVVE